MDDNQREWIKELEVKAKQEKQAKRDQSQPNDNTLLIKDKFTSADGKERINTLKLKPLPDGNIQLWLKNGNYWGTLQLQPEGAKEVVEFLQRNMKVEP